jgi:hypothetical protein
MSRRAVLIILILLVLMLFGLGGLAGYALVRPFGGVDGGQSRRSPDGKWMAYATSFSERTVLGGKRRFSELRVDNGAVSGQTIRRMVIEDTAEPGIDWRIEGEVFWARNSSAVTFKCVTGKANLEVTLTP